MPISNYAAWDLSALSRPSCPPASRAPGSSPPVCASCPVSLTTCCNHAASWICPQSFPSITSSSLPCMLPLVSVSSIPGPSEALHSGNQVWVTSHFIRMIPSLSQLPAASPCPLVLHSSLWKAALWSPPPTTVWLNVTRGKLQPCSVASL